MKKFLRQSLSVVLTALMVFSCFSLMTPTTVNALPATDSTYATGDKYGTPKWSGTGDRWFQWATGSDYVKVYYPSQIYLDVSETLQGAGYHFDVEWHFGDSSNYRIILGAPVWGDHSAFSGMPTKYYTMNNIFSDYAVDASLPPNAPGGWYGDGTGSSTDYDLRIVGYGYSSQGSDGFTANGARHEKYILWRNNTNAGDPVRTSIYLKGTPSSSYKGTTTEYNTSGGSIGSYGLAQSYGSNNSWPTHSSSSMFNTKGSSSGYMEGQWIEMAWNVTIYDKSALNSEIVKAGQIITAQNNYKQYVVAGNFNDLIQHNSDAQNVIVTREQTQSDIDSTRNALYNAANTLYYGASNETLLSLAAEAESYINSAEYAAKYTESSRTNLESVLSGIKALSYYSSVPRYHAYSDSSAGSKAASDQSAINSAVAELQTAINELRSSVAYYTVLFNKADGTAKKLTYAYGFTIPASSIPANTVKEADAVNHYTYSWDKEINYTVTGDASYTEFLTTEAHDWNDWHTTVYPNCTTEGSMYRTCKICNYMQEDIIPATAHTPLEPVISNKTEATCEKNGSYISTVYCSECANVISADTVTVPAPGHTDGEKVKENETAPTCTVDGSYDEVVYCTVCDEEVSRKNIIVGASHVNGDPVITTKESTCLEAGYTKTTVSCTVCGEILRETVEPAEPAEHTAGEALKENEKNATCTENGGYDMVTRCTVCSFIMNSEHFTTEAGEHDWGEWETVAPVSCIKNGLERRVCKNDASHTEENTLKSPGHTEGSPEELERVDADCLFDGYYVTVTKCTVCGAETSRTRTVIKAEGHSFGDWYESKAAACSEEGEEKRDCENCKHYETRALEKTAHDYESVVTPPTCTSDGYTTYICSECGDTYTDNETEKNGHTEEKIPAADATCTEAGLTEGVKCSVCGEILTAQEDVPAPGHDMGEWVVTTPATCTAKGEERADCSECDYFETRELDTVAHTWADADCTKPSTCTVCGAISGDAIGHDMGEWTVTAPATCTAKGEERADCSRCDYYETREITAPGHTKEKIPAVEATCTEAGLTEGVKCSVCGEVLTAQEDVPALDHTMGEWTVTAPATCTAKGEERADCSRCDYYETREITAPGHTKEIIPAVDASCTEAGLTEGVKCSVCGEILTAQEDVPALDHTMGEWTVTASATCTAKGEERADCSVCDYYETKEIAKLSHAEEAVPGKAPTCTEAGLTEGVKCSVCGEAIVSQKTVPAKGHNLGEWTEVKAPACNEEGLEAAECSECDYTETRAVPEKEHEYDENGVCTQCGTEENCPHICHKEHNIFARIVWGIIRFICSIFGVGRTCSCGDAHY